jgi:hypothetical protein
MSMSFDQIRGSLDKMISLLKQIAIHTNDSGCCTADTSAGSNSSIPAGFSSISIVQTSATGGVDVTMSDSTVFGLQIQGEVFVDVAGPGKKLPAYPIVANSGGTWKWHGIK